MTLIYSIFFQIFAIAVTGAYSQSYNYPPPSQPIGLGNSPHGSIADLPLSSGYNYPSPGGSASQGIRSSLPAPSSSYDSSPFGSSPSGSSLFGGSQGYNYQPPASASGSFQSTGPSGGFDSSSFGSSPQGSSFNGGNSLGGYNYDSPGFASNGASSFLPRPHDLSSAGSFPAQNFNHGQSVAPSLDYGAPSGSHSHPHHNNAPFPSEQVNKHVYVYVAPQDPQEAASKQVFVPSPVVNHKIIFIKAPQQAQVKSQVIPLPPKTEEKTLVYVLVKKPEEQQIDVQPLPQRAASKPEVYFIKYNTKKDGGDNGGLPSGVQPHPGLPIVEDVRHGGQDPSTSQSINQGSPIYGPPH